MKRIYSLIIIALFTLSLFGQNNTFEKRLNNLRAQKIAYITQRINLTPEEAQIFWPIYNELSQKKDEINKRRKEIIFELKNNWDSYSDKEKEALSDEFINLKLKDAQLDIEYNKKFKKVLSIEKILELYQAELSFKNYLLKRIRQQNANKGKQYPPKRRLN